MSALDYGVNVRINNIFVNKNTGDLTRYTDMTKMPDDIYHIPVTIGTSSLFGEAYRIYLGDKDLLLAFYKNIMVITQHGKLKQTIWCGNDTPKRQNIRLDNQKTIRLTYLDPANPDNGRYLAEWTHNGKQYAVMFGYGITNEEKCWHRVRKLYGFTQAERRLMKTWYETGCVS